MDEERAEALHCYIENLEETYQDKIEEDKYSKQDFKPGILAWSKKTFSAWNEFAASYVIGWAMWGGDGMMLQGINVIVERLLDDSESPWKKLKLWC